MNREVEIKLIITDFHPGKVIEILSRADSIGRFPLGPPLDIRIHDVYFDTADHLLGKNRLSLRIRTTGEGPWITLKGKTIIHQWGGVDRMEIEQPWSRPALDEISEILQKSDVRLATRSFSFDPADPVKTMRNLKLEILQDRETHRISRQVEDPAEPDVPLAELALDVVTFQLNTQEIIHAEIEIESKKTGEASVLKTVVDHLHTLFPGTFRAATYSKLTLGLILQELSEEGNFKNYIGRNNYLLPAAYDRINEKFLRLWE